MSEVQNDVSTARAIAAEAGRILLQLRSAADESIRRGEIFDESALRSAGDAAAQSAISEALAKAFPRDCVLSEEAADNLERLDADRVWIVDPLDGTREFGERNPEGGWRDDFAVHVALWERIRGLTIGAVALPGRGQIFGSDAPPAVPTSPRGKLEACRQPNPPTSIRSGAETSGVATLVPMGSAGVKVMAVVTGEVDAYIHAGGQYQWDSAAPVAIALAAGLVATRLDGSPLRYNVRDLLLPISWYAIHHELTRSERSWMLRVTDGAVRRVKVRQNHHHEEHQMKGQVMSQLAALEAESIHIFREVAAEMERPCLLFSGGKDSIVMLHVARKAFAPAPIPFPVMHVDTGLNFAEVIAYRDRWAAQLGLRLVVASVQDAIERGVVKEEPNGSRNRIQTPVLLEAAAREKFDALFGGGRRDEEKARAKERVFSFRDEFGQWDPKNQRPEIWSLYNGRVFPGESIRVFPLSNWTELDIWSYIEAENIEIPSLYLAAEREVVERDGMLYAVNEFVALKSGEVSQKLSVRYRTMGDANLTAAVESVADTVAKVVEEIAAARITERGATRGDDKVSEAAMEDRKKEGYF